MNEVDHYTTSLSTQLRKGILPYCVLLVCVDQPQYTSQIIKRLQAVGLDVGEGTIYPLLNRLQKDGLLAHEWQESEQGPPRKYYRLTSYGEQMIVSVRRQTNNLRRILDMLQ